MHAGCPASWREQSRGTLPDGLCSGAGLGWCRIASAGLLCEHKPQEDQPFLCFAGSLLVSSEPQNCPKLLKKKSCFPQIRKITCYSVLTGTGVLSKVTLRCSVLTSASVHLCFICMHLHISAMRFIITRKGLTQGAGGKQPSCGKIKKSGRRIQPEREKGQQAGQERRGGYEPGGEAARATPGQGEPAGCCLEWGRCLLAAADVALICGHTRVGRGLCRVGTLFGDLTCLQGLVQLGFSSP